jgi:hypothetical protein
MVPSTHSLNIAAMMWYFRIDWILCGSLLLLIALWALSTIMALIRQLRRTIVCALSIVIAEGTNHSGDQRLCEKHFYCTEVKSPYQPTPPCPLLYLLLRYNDTTTRYHLSFFSKRCIGIPDLSGATYSHVMRRVLLKDNIIFDLQNTSM